MKTRGLKRLSSAALSLILIVLSFSRFGGIAEAAISIDKNDKTRHVVSTALSDQAKAYYANGNDFASLIQLDGRKTNDSTVAIGSPLFNRLKTLMKPVHTISYSSLTDYWEYTDTAENSTHAMLFYSDVPAASASAFNREHVWPKSRGNFVESGAGSDLQHLRPTNSQINSDRSSYTMGNVREKTGGNMSVKTYNGTPVLWLITNYSGNDCNGLVEVKDDVKGDVARILLYVYVTYGSSNANKNLFTKCSSYGSDSNDGCKVIESLDTLLEWIAIDPVDEWEMRRNDLAEDVQGNRNVFIDFPELAWYLFGRGDEIPENMVTPSSAGSGVIEEPETPVRLNFYVNNALYAVRNGVSNDTFTLPDSVPEVYGWTFEGWVTERTEETLSAPDLIYSGSYTASSNTNFHALYTRREEGSGSGGWVKVTSSSALTAGSSIVFTSKDNEVVAGTLDGAVLKSVDCKTFSGNTITALPDSAAVFTVGTANGGYTFTSSAGQLFCSAVKKLNFSGTGSGVFSISFDDGHAVVASSISSYGKLQYNSGSPRFTTYTSSQQPIEIYKMDGAPDVVYYTTSPTIVAHTHVFENGVCTLCGESEFMPGDLNGDGAFSELDVIHYLYVLVFPDLYTLNQPADYTHDGKEDLEDALLILYCYYFPDDYDYL